VRWLDSQPDASQAYQWLLSQPLALLGTVFPPEVLDKLIEDLEGWHEQDDLPF
jgi:hypothetical protein